MLTLKPGDTFAEHYQLVKLVDVGGFAEVWEAIFTGEAVALKIFPRLNETGIDKVRSEFRQSVLLHTHLIVPTYFGVYEGHPYLVMRFCRGGNASEKTGECDEAEIAKILYQVGNALSYLHAKEIIHQDIKPNNFLLDEEGNYYLTDLGLSIKLRQAIQKYTQAKNSETVLIGKTTTGIAPPCYRGPELYENAQPVQPVKATDIWAFGASMFELATGDVPFGDMGGMIQINNPKPPNLPAKFSFALNQIIKKCLSKNTWDRPKADEVADWADYYLKTGSWPSEFQHQPDPVVIVPEGGSKKQMLLLLLLALLLGGGAWVIYAYEKNSPDKNDDKPESHGARDSTATNTIVPVTSPKDADGDHIPDSIDKCQNTPLNVAVDSKGCPIDISKDGAPDHKAKDEEKKKRFSTSTEDSTAVKPKRLEQLHKDAVH